MSFRSSVIYVLMFLFSAAACKSSVNAAALIVENGEANASILIAERPPRMTKLAARELQTYIEKISGARLEIVTEQTGKLPVTIYVGQSSAARRVGVNADGLDYGAYRIVSKDNWLALVGNDEDFEPVEPWARSHGHWTREVLTQWDELTDAHWSNPLASRMYKNYSGHPYDYGKPVQEPSRDTGDVIQFWKFDKRGSLNAVYAFLRDLGARWYMPGELGEILPTKATIALPESEKTVQPDIKIRSMSWDRYHAISREQLLWSLRLGLNKVCAPMHHGIANITRREEPRTLHPEWYQVRQGKRDTESRRPKACLSSPGLLAENVRFVRFMFDKYDVPIVSVMPQDGFTRICECPRCKPKATPERGARGRFSDYVWDYVNRVAAEVAKTHPNKKIMCGAYSTYQLPPDKIDKLLPNVLVQITNGRPRTSLDGEFHKELDELRKRWLEKSHNKLSITINYHFGYQPFYVPHVIARGLRDIKDQVWREDCWFMPFSKTGLYKPGVNHVSIYVMSRLWWDADQDVDQLLDEYYRLYYGPARGEMKRFVEYCETNYAALTENKEKVNRALELFEVVKSHVDSDSVYGKRIALVDAYLDELRKRQKQLAKGREDVPVFSRTINLGKDKWRDARETLTMDGKLEEPFWQAYPHGAGLRELASGGKHRFQTRFLARWYNNNLYFGIRCQDSSEKPANIGSTKDDDWAIWDGDHVEILLETAEHSYYQIVVNPAGAVLDLDRGVRKANWFKWSSQAEVAAHVGEDYWSVEVRIPITEATDDPLHQVIGQAPSETMPWYFNVCRKRIRDDDVEVSAYSPTGGTFHEVMKFAKMYVR